MKIERFMIVCVGILCVMMGISGLVGVIGQDSTMQIGDVFKPRELHITYQPSCDIVFYNNEGKVIGRLYWGDDVFRFAGNVDSSATMFFNHFLKNLVDEYIRSKK